MPRFPGCEHLATAEEKHKCADEKFLGYIHYNLRYPEEARERGIEGTVVARFVIEKDGSMREASIISDIGGGCGEEVLRVLYLMNEQHIRWTPQPARGRPVAVEFTVPVTFPPYKEQDTPLQVERVYPPPPPPSPPPGKEEVFKVVEHMPRFPGCENIPDKEERKKCADAKFLQFIYSNLRYPDEAREQGIEGTVIARFVIAKDGSLIEPSIVKDIGGGCGEEVLRVLHLISEQNIKWVPGPSRGRPVNVEFNIPVRFPPLID